MPYRFNYDLSSISQPLFREITRICNEEEVHERTGEVSHQMVKRLKIQKVTGLPLSDTFTVIEDLIKNHMENQSQREEFQNTDKRALFLPHCSRKYMDNRCQANFDPALSSYFCAGCSSDCPIKHAVKAGKRKDYDVYIMPGGSGIRKLAKNYEGIIGVACCVEINLAKKILKDDNLVILGVPLIKNGCSNTSFNLETLNMIL